MEYKLSDPSQEEITAFKLDFEKFLDEKNMQFTPYPIFKPSESGKWEIECGIAIQKKTLVEKAEASEEEIKENR